MTVAITRVSMAYFALLAWNLGCISPEEEMLRPVGGIADTCLHSSG